MNTHRNIKGIFSIASAMAFLLIGIADVWAAKDQLRIKINQVSPGIVALTEGGSALAEDTFSSSASIKVQYELNAFNFPTGAVVFGTFNLGLEIEDRSAAPGSDTSYSTPLTVNVNQPGSDGPNLLLSASPAGYSGISGPGNLGSLVVTITTNCTLANPCPSTDGAEIVANLQFSANPGSQLGTNVKVQVRIKLVHPDDCVKLYTFVTDQELVNDVNSTEVVVVSSGRNAGKVTSTTPYGQFSQNVLVANICTGLQSFDLKITLDPSFDTNPNDNPGNAVFTYLAGEEVDPATFDIGQFGLPTPQGQTLCVANVQLNGDETLLATVHMGVRRGIQYSDLSSSPFTFLADLYPANSACSGTATASADATMSYTLK
jgi:hypothetical protein